MGNVQTTLSKVADRICDLYDNDKNNLQNSIMRLSTIPKEFEILSPSKAFMIKSNTFMFITGSPTNKMYHYNAIYDTWNFNGSYQCNWLYLFNDSVVYRQKTNELYEFSGKGPFFHFFSRMNVTTRRHSEHEDIACIKGNDWMDSKLIWINDTLHVFGRNKIEENEYYDYKHHFKIKTHKCDFAKSEMKHFTLIYLETKHILYLFDETLSPKIYKCDIKRNFKWKELSVMTPWNTNEYKICGNIISTPNDQYILIFADRILIFDTELERFWKSRVECPIQSKNREIIFIPKYDKYTMNMIIIGFVLHSYILTDDVVDIIIKYIDLSEFVHILRYGDKLNNQHWKLRIEYILQNADPIQT